MANATSSSSNNRSTAPVLRNQQVAIVFGASRGIGREIALQFGRGNLQFIKNKNREGFESLIRFVWIILIAGASVCVAAKTTQDSSNLPGTIFQVAEEVFNN